MQGGVEEIEEEEEEEEVEDEKTMLFWRLQMVEVDYFGTKWHRHVNVDDDRFVSL